MRCTVVEQPRSTAKPLIDIGEGQMEDYGIFSYDLVARPAGATIQSTTLHFKVFFSSHEAVSEASVDVLIGAAETNR
jgi:hypothetical protein